MTFHAQGVKGSINFSNNAFKRQIKEQRAPEFLPLSSDRVSSKHSFHSNNERRREGRKKHTHTRTHARTHTQRESSLGIHLVDQRTGRSPPMHNLHDGHTAENVTPLKHPSPPRRERRKPRAANVPPGKKRDCFHLRTRGDSIVSA